MFKIFAPLFFIVLFCTYQANAEDKSLTLKSSAFEDNADIPTKYTCKGSDINPPLSIQNVPAKTGSLALFIHDPDALEGEWSHWVVYNIKPHVKEIAENSIPGTELFNDFGKFHYGGPCPPDDRPHHYIFELYALKKPLRINEGGTVKDLQKAMSGQIISKTKLTGIYQKPSW